jgi:hypothetical protein
MQVRWLVVPSRTNERTFMTKVHLKKIVSGIVFGVCTTESFVFSRTVAVGYCYIRETQFNIVV